MFEQAFRNIDDALRKEAGCATELDYAEQTSWLLFLKYLDSLEQDRAMEAQLEGKARAANAKIIINTRFDSKQQVFLNFVLSHYVKVGVEELDPEKLSPLLRLKYGAIQDAVADLGNPEQIGQAFVEFQKFLYARVAQSLPAAGIAGREN